MIGLKFDILGNSLFAKITKTVTVDFKPNVKLIIGLRNCRDTSIKCRPEHFSVDVSGPQQPLHFQYKYRAYKGRIDSSLIG